MSRQLLSSPTGFPFTRELSLVPLIAAWREAAAGDGVAAQVAAVVEKELSGAPGLLVPIEDAGIVAKHRDLVDVLMSEAFPRASWDQDHAAALAPFSLRAFYATPSFARLFTDGDGLLLGRMNLDERSRAAGHILKAYAVILRKYYDIELALDYPLILTIDDPDSGLERHFRLQFDLRFLEAEARGPVPSLTDDERQRLLANLGDPDTLMALIPPAPFVLRGFTVLKATDVTDQEVLSSLKRDLIEKESIVSSTRFQSLQAKVRTLFRRPDLRLGLAAIQGDRVFVLNYGCELAHNCIFADSVHRNVQDFAGSIYERAARQGQPVIVDDLATYPARSAIDDLLVAMGLRSVVVAPLQYQGRVIGTLELGSPRPGDFPPMTTLKLGEVLPLFSMAVRRSLEELEARVQATIKEKCTAIHPSVEWRFRRAVLNRMERRAGGGAAEMEPILFEGVYPLYGASDIRGSSTQRNVAIQADLVAQLRLAREIVRLAHDAKRLPILDELGYRIDRHIGHVELLLNSGDELMLLAFLRQHVEPLFEHLAGFGPAVRDGIAAYRAALDPHAGMVYRQRKDYEESVTLINDTISSYLDAEQELAQGMFPHYFEKQRTDGVDYTIYVGASLVEGDAFDELYLRNLRLWQLMVTCGIARQTEALRATSKMPLEATHLILAHHAPLAIRFRFDEKRFDVDGAYNVRYEVIKKRIDKAVTQGTRERVTQPGKIAIIYSQPSEAAEYRAYSDYLRAAGYLTGEVEELELEALQGVHGLRALRVGVDLSDPASKLPPSARAAVDGVRALAR